MPEQTPFSGYEKRDEVDEFFGKFNLDDFIKAFNKGDHEWHKNEWKKFIEQIRQAERSRILTLIEEMKKGSLSNRSDWNASLTSLQAKIKE